MDNNLNFLFNFQTNAEKVTATINRVNAATINVGKAVVKVDSAFVGIINNINKKLSDLNFTNILQQVNMIADGFSSLAQPGLQLSTSMYDLQAITGVAGEKLKEIESYARENAKTFGGTAADGVESYKLILSQLSPEIGKVPVALKEMGTSVGNLSKLMGGDTAAATEVLTTAMNQYQISTENPLQASKEMADMMNVMAAAAQEGSAELPQIKQALEQAGMAAKTAGVSFAETNSAIQVLDKAGKKGSEGGVALRNIMATLSEGRFLPKDVQKELAAAGISTTKLGDKTLSLADRMKPLRRIMTDQALVTKLFGKENSNAAIALISGISEQERLTGAITGTNSAYEQAAIVMDSPAEKNKRLQAQIDNFKISLFNGTNGVLGYMGVIGSLTKSATDIAPLFMLAGKAVDFVASKEKLQAFWSGVVAVKNRAVAIATGLWTGAQLLLNTAMSANPIGLIVLAVVALVGIVTTAIYYYDQFGAAMMILLGPIGMVISAFKSVSDHWTSIKEAFSGGGIIAGLKRIGVVLLDVLLKPVQQLLELIAKIPGLGKIAQGGADAVKSLRTRLDLVTPGEIIKEPSKKANGIAAAKLAGITGGGGGSGVLAGKDKTKTNEAIATGGTKNTTVHITLGEMIGIKAGTVNGSNETIEKVGGAMEDNLLRVLAMASSSAS